MPYFSRILRLPKRAAPISILTPGDGTLWTVETIKSNNLGSLADIIFDGSNMWASDMGAGKLYKIDLSGNIVQTVEVGGGPINLAFDGANIWAPNFESNTISIVQAATDFEGGGALIPLLAAFIL